MSFSILYRIEWVVTGQVTLGGAVENDFQYPVSDRMGCNLAWVAQPFAYTFHLSVSCIGSNGL